jgi:hypothetical protein
MQSLRAVLSATALLVLALPVAHAQIVIEPMVGGYVPGSNVSQVQGNATDIAKTRDGTLSLGLNVDLGMLRGTLAYASGTTIKNASKQDIGKGNVFAAAADLVIRPLPRIFVQPYLIAGAGEKFYKYDASASLLNTADEKEFAFHGGLGADLMLGKMGVAAELTDFLSKGNVHDAFLMVGLRLPIGM